MSEEPEIKAIPVGDRILVEPDPVDEKIDGLFLPEQSREDSVTGVVVAVGKGRNEIAMECNVGDRVLFSKYSGQDVSVNGVKHKIMRESDVFCRFPSQKLKPITI